MIYGLLASLTIFVHLIWILFLISGFFFAFYKPKIALVHFGGLLFSLILNLQGWYCPLTYLENYLYALHDVGEQYTGPFVLHRLERFIYPNLPEHELRVVEIIFVCLYIIGYAYLAKRYHVFRSIKEKVRVAQDRIGGAPLA